MILGFTGHLGAGKTLGVTYFAWRLSYAAGGVSVLANYPIREEYFEPHRKRNPQFRCYYVRDQADWLQFAAGGGGIVALDEFHRLADSRLSMDRRSVVLTHFFAFLRKINATALVTDQHQAFMDLRMRALVDGWIACECQRAGGSIRGFRYAACDQYGRPRKSMFASLSQVQPLFNAYDTKQIIRGFSFPSDMKAFDKFLDSLQEALDHAAAARGVVEPPTPSVDELMGLLGVG